VSDLILMLAAVVLDYDPWNGDLRELTHVWYDFCTSISFQFERSDPLYAELWWQRRCDFDDRSDGWMMFRAPIS
jgi:hypothetical protein